MPKIFLKQKQILKQSKGLFVTIASLFEASRNRIVRNVNQELTLLNWQKGKHIHEILEKTDESYGSEKVTHYLTKLPEMKAIKSKLGKAIKAAQQRLIISSQQ